MLLQHDDLTVVGRDDEPRLDVAWARAAGLFKPRPRLTADELLPQQEKLEELPAPYLRRTVEDAPGNARRVRILAYFLPDAVP